MSRQPNEVADDTDHPWSEDNVELAQGSSTTQCLVTGTWEVAEIEIKNSVHVDKVNGRLISVRQTCGGRNKLVVNMDKSVIANMTNFNVQAEKMFQWPVATLFLLAQFTECLETKSLDYISLVILHL